MVLALPVSQHFSVVFPQLKDAIGAVVVRDFNRLPDNIPSSLIRTYHTNGLVDNKFAADMDENFFILAKRNKIEHISFDLGPSCADVRLNPEENDCFWPHNESPVLSADSILRIARERIMTIRKSFYGRLAVENLDYHKGGAYEHVCDPGFITEAVKELGVSLAFDIAHAIVTSFSFGMDLHDYLRKLPLEAVSEIHLSHPEKNHDMHEVPTDYEYELLSFLLSRVSPDFIVVEYYGEPSKIIREYMRLFKFLKEHK